MTKMDNRIKVLVVDDLASARVVIRKILEKDWAIEVIGEAVDGLDAIKKTEELKPDLIVMDVRMSNMDGYESVKRITAFHPIPIIMVSASEGEPLEMWFNALEAGAVDLLPKPVYHSRTLPAEALELIGKIKSLAGFKLPGIISGGSEKTFTAYSTPRQLTDISITPEILVITASSGGPKALLKVLTALDSDFPAPILVVQHINQEFFGHFLNWMKKTCQLPIKKAEKSESITKGTVYLAGPGKHLTVDKNRKFCLDDSPPWHNLRPTANKLFSSVAEVYREKVVGVILTGMGDDGSEGAVDIKRQGGYVISQDEKTSTVFGMPASAIEQGAVNLVLPLDLIGCRLNRIFSEKKE